MKSKLRYMAVIFGLWLAGSALAAEKTYTVAGDSMAPALVSGDRVVVSDDKWNPLNRGDMVAIRFKHSQTPIVKRIIAVDGDRVEIKDNVIAVNGEKIRDVEMSHWKTTITQLERYGWVVPRKNVFILGDNPANSLDSRRLGLISTDQIEGRVVGIVKRNGPVATQRRDLPGMSSGI